MIIEDQIKDEKLQYDINREAAKVSVLSSGKINKYESLTGEEILPSNQQQIIEQAKFTYSPLGKAFEKQTKTIEDQGEKQIKAIQDNKEQSVNNYDYKKELLLSKEREIFKDIYNKRLDEIEEMNKKVNYNDLKYEVRSSGEEFELDNTEDPFAFLNDIKKGKILLQKAKNIQKEYKKYLNKIRRGNKTQEQIETLANMDILFNARDEAIRFFEDYGSIILEAKRLAKEQEGIGLKILTPNQILKRLPIALAQIKAGDNSESLLNEIRQIAYSLYRSKEITKKVYNNIIKSIKV